MKRLLLILIALILALGAPSLARAEEDDRGQDNSAIAVNRKDGSSLFKLAFKIKRVAGGVVDATNSAVAYSECESCKTTAIAFEIVLVTGDTSNAQPVNQAIALNYQCTLCETFAAAHQWVISTGGPVRFTSEGKQELARIRRELRALRDEDLSPFELARRVKALAARVRTVLDTQLVRVRDDDDEGEAEDEEEQVETEGAVTQPPAPATTDESEGQETTSTPSTTTTPATTTEPAATTTAPTTTTTTATTPTETEPPATTTTP